MCGIAGIVAYDGFDPGLLVSMTHLVSHRGPDGYGFAFFESGPGGQSEIIHNEHRLPGLRKPVVGLGHRRLAILDMSSRGSQPMRTNDGTLYITHNGEVYNFLELRQQLKAKGYSFATQTDTEVILHAYREWGVECLARFEGMWSFALLDRLQQRLFCSRDRFGEKPFYYFVGKGCFVFGSEIKQILAFPGVSRMADESAVFNYLEWGSLDYSEATLVAGVRQLPGGHFLVLDLRRPSLVPEIRRYWQLSVQQPRRLSDREACEEFKARLENAIRLRLRSDVPVGACLSGGLDSSSVVCLARKVVPEHPFHTFSSCFSEPSCDERRYSSRVVAATGVTPHQVFPQPGQFWQGFAHLLWHQDEPVGSTNVYAQWCVMECAEREGIPVLLDGQGGDETLCGYQKFYLFYLWHLLREANPRVVPEAALWVKNHTRSLWTWEDARRYLPQFSGYSPLTARVCPRQVRQHFAGDGRGRQFGPAVSIAERQRLDLISTSLPALLHYEDRNGMAHSVETRLPFLDHELAGFLVNCRPSLKLRHGWSKWILRNALVGTLPEEIRLRRTKLGFDTPLAEWLRRGLRDGLMKSLAAPDFQMNRFLIKERVVQELDRFMLGKHGCLNAAALFRVLTLELWGRVHGIN